MSVIRPTHKKIYLAKIIGESESTTGSGIVRLEYDTPKETYLNITDLSGALGYYVYGNEVEKMKRCTYKYTEIPKDYFTEGDLAYIDVDYNSETEENNGDGANYIVDKVLKYNFSAEVYFKKIE